MRKVGAYFCVTWISVVFLTACGQTPPMPETSVLPDTSISSATITETTTTTAEETATTTKESITTTTTTAEEIITTTKETTNTTAKPTTTITKTKPIVTNESNTSSRATKSTTMRSTVIHTTIVSPCDSLATMTTPTTTVPTTTTTANPTTIATTTTTEDATTTTTTISTRLTTYIPSTTKVYKGPPLDSLTLDWMGETVVVTYEANVIRYDYSFEERASGLTIITKEEMDGEKNWRYCGFMKDGTEIRCVVLPEHKRILYVYIVDDISGQGADDEAAVRDKVLEELCEMGYSYTAQDVLVDMNKDADGSQSYFAYVTANNETDGGLFMEVRWTDERGWQIVRLFMDVHNRYRMPKWN